MVPSAVVGLRLPVVQILRRNLYLVATLAVLHGTALTVTTKKEQDDACRCMNWVDAYAPGGGAECPLGAEHDAVIDFEQPWMSMTRICKDWFRQIPQGYNMCVNLDPWKPYYGQWCYVSVNCTNLNGGKKVKNKKHEFRKAAWKRCTPDEDDMMKYWNVTKLFNFNDMLHSKDMGTTARLAWPTLKQKWAFVKKIWDGQDTVIGQDGVETVVILHSALADKLKKLYFEKKPTLFDYFEYEVGSSLVVGKQVYWVPPMMRGGTLKCILNCDDDPLEGRDYGTIASLMHQHHIPEHQELVDSLPENSTNASARNTTMM